MSGSNPYENNFCPPDRFVKLIVVQNNVYLIFRTNHILVLKTASNITRLDPCNTRKILKIGAHNWNIMSENSVRRTEEVAGQSVHQLKIFISRLVILLCNWP